MDRNFKKQFVKHLRKRTANFCFVVAVVAGIAFTGIAGTAAAEDKGGTRRLINPEIFLNGIRIRHIVATLDGDDFGDCWADHAQPGNVCIKPRPICRAALERLAAPPSCTFDEFDALAPAFTAARNACGRGIPRAERDATCFLGNRRQSFQSRCRALLHTGGDERAAAADHQLRSAR